MQKKVNILDIPPIEQVKLDRILEEIQKKTPGILGFSILLNTGIPIQATSSISTISDPALFSAMGAAVFNISQKTMIDLFNDSNLGIIMMQGEKGVLILRGIVRYSLVLLVMAKKDSELGFIYYTVDKLARDISLDLDQQV
ncbi:MAG: roadblock/LC7 domain-containing protein [Candidatus Hodarchaeales archaeon]